MEGTAAFVVLCVVLFGPWLAVATSAAVTFFHALEETSGPAGPLWDEFGRLSRVVVPEWVGFAGVGVLLPGALIGAAVAGYGFGIEWALSALVGARLGDAFWSHWGPWLLLGSRPNPGLRTSVPGLIEAAAVLAFGHVEPLPAWIAGNAFALTLPTLWLLGRWKLFQRYGSWWEDL